MLQDQDTTWAEVRAYDTLQKKKNIASGLTMSNNPSLSIPACTPIGSILPIPSHTCCQVSVNRLLFGGDILLKYVYVNVLFSMR